MLGYNLGGKCFTHFTKRVQIVNYDKKTKTMQSKIYLMETINSQLMKYYVNFLCLFLSKYIALFKCCSSVTNDKNGKGASIK